jgi:hypothetical protein
LPYVAELNKSIDTWCQHARPGNGGRSIYPSIDYGGGKRRSDICGDAMRPSPLDPRIGSMRAATASAHFAAGRYDEASSWAEKALRDDPDSGPAARASVALLTLG